MRPFFNSFVPRPNQYPQQNLQPNPQQALQNRMQSQMGMMNPQHQAFMDNRQLMNNPFVGQFNSLIPNFNQLNPNPQMAQQFYHNFPNVSQQVHPLALPNINQLVPQGAPFFPNVLDGLQFVMANANILGQNLVQSSVDSFQQVQPNSSSPLSYPTGQHPNQRLQRPVFTESEGQSIKNVQGGNFGCKGTDLHHEQFNKNPKVNVHSQGFQKSRFRHADAGKRTFEMSNNRQGKVTGQSNKIAADIDQSNPPKISKDKKRSFALVYTAKEIEQWREQRRKSYPSKANVEKKLKGKPTDCGADNDEKMRRQQLKEILAKQAELGVEVAEIPSHYLANADGQATGGEAKGKQFSTSQRFVNNNDTRGKFNKKQNRRGKEYGKREKFGKKRKFQPNDSPSVSSSSMRELTLLEKLLSAEVKRDKNQMLQVCRFMVLNSFFLNCPQQPLKCPLVIIKEHGSERVEEDNNSDIKRKIETESSDDDEQAEEGAVKRDEKSEGVSGSGLN